MIFKVPRFIKYFYPSYLWNYKTKEKVLYITFDDGPIPEVTPWVLDELSKYNAKATFFCIGDNVVKHPEIYKRILNENHQVGNHTFNHLNGWKTENSYYLENIEKCRNYIDSNLFRPPFGKIKKSQFNVIKKSYRIVLWSILAWDFLQNLDQKYALKNIIKKTKRGDIIVFHDSLKAEKNLRFILPEYLKYFSEKGFEFKTIT